MNDYKMIDDIVAMLDAGVAKGQGHINVKVEDKNATEKEIVNGTADCSMNSMACAVPTMILDDDDEFEL